MLPFVLGGIAVAAAGFAAREFYGKEADGADFADADNTADAAHRSETEVMQMPKSQVPSALFGLLKNIETYRQTLEAHIPSHSAAQHTAASLHACVRLLQDAHETGAFYLRHVRAMGAKSTDDLSAVEDRLLTYARMFLQSTQTLLSQPLTDETGTLPSALFEAFLLYHEALEKHKEKLRLFRCTKENYTLFLTGFDK